MIIDLLVNKPRLNSGNGHLQYTEKVKTNFRTVKSQPQQSDRKTHSSGKQINGCKYLRCNKITPSTCNGKHRIFSVKKEKNDFEKKIGSSGMRSPIENSTKKRDAKLLVDSKIKKTKFSQTQLIHIQKTKENSAKSKEECEKFNKTQKVKLVDEKKIFEISKIEENSINHEVVNPLPSELSSQPYPLPETTDQSPKTNDILSKILITGDEIAKGSYATVKSAYHKNLQKIVALKIYDKSILKDHQRKIAVQREVEVMQHLNNPYIVKLYEVIETDTQVIITMEYINGKSLYNYIREHEEKRLNEEEAKRLFKQIVTGINFCHEKLIAHRDIKIENILLNENNDAKIIDFGFSTVTSKGEKDKLYCGTLSYMAPEIFSRREYEGFPADIWALGVVLYAMLCGKFPFKGTKETEIRQEIIQKKCKFPDYISPQAKSLMTHLLKIDPNERPTVQEILNDSWLTPPKSLIKTSNCFSDRKQYNSKYALRYSINDEKDITKSIKRNYSGIKGYLYGKVPLPIMEYYGDDMNKTQCKNELNIINNQLNDYLKITTTSKLIRNKEKIKSSSLSVNLIKHRKSMSAIQENANNCSKGHSKHKFESESNSKLKKWKKNLTYMVE